MKNNFFRIMALTVFLIFLALYYSSNAGLIDYQAKNKTSLTEEQIKMFEEDVKNNVQIDLKKYVDNKEDRYDNNISKTTLKLSNTIGETVEGILNFVFGKLENAMNG
ncbi:MAG: hypothetical protein MRZ42_05895 [Tenericutes bacterium]|nr:hypothetical protein [Mycoplasmatota bacterium]